MPELPEVETIARWLREGNAEAPSLVGQQIESAELLWSKTLAAPAPDLFRGLIKGRVVTGLTTRGKFIMLTLDQGFLLFHLRMSGLLYMRKTSPSADTDPAAKHDRLRLHLASGWDLVFNDTRKFGRAWLVEDALEVTGKLGPQPFDPGLTAEKFHIMLMARARQLKPLLLDQSFLAGLGNIYTDEALFSARLHPLRLANSLTLKEAARLLAAIREVLTLGIAHNGASIDWAYRGGEFQNHCKVYQQTGSPCPRCGTPIQRTTVGQRGTHYCPNCQALPEEEDVR